MHHDCTKHHSWGWIKFLKRCRTLFGAAGCVIQSVHAWKLLQPDDDVGKNNICSNRAQCHSHCACPADANVFHFVAKYPKLEISRTFFRRLRPLSAVQKHAKHETCKIFDNIEIQVLHYVSCSAATKQSKIHVGQRSLIRQDNNQANMTQHDTIWSLTFMTCSRCLHTVG